MVRTKRKTNRVLRPIRDDEIYDTWEMTAVNYDKTYLWNACNQILHELKVRKINSNMESTQFEIDQSLRVLLNVDEVTELICKYLQVFVDRTKSTPSVYITDITDVDLVTDNYNNLDTLISQLSFNNNKDVKVSTSRDLQSEEITRRIINKLSKIEDCDDIRFLPDDHISTSKGVYDVRSQSYLTDDQLQEYDLTYKYDWYIMTDDLFNQLSDEDKSLYQFAKEGFSRAFYNWSCRDEDLTDLDEDKQYILKQVMLKAVLGKGSGRLVLLQGDGGNGKSSYMDCILKLIGKNYTMKMNIQNIADENKLCKIQSDTKVILGLDAATNTHLKNEALSNFKSLIQGEELLINEKYRPSRYVEFNGPYIQATNTDISFHENSDAIRDRLVKITMSPVNFRHRTDKIDFNKMLSTTLGRCALITLLVEDIKDDIDSYRLTEEMLAEVDKVVNEADTLTHFLDSIKHEFYGIKYISDFYLYEKYKEWHSSNMSGSRLNSTNCKKQMVSVMSSIGYQARYDENRHRSRRDFNPNRFNADDCFKYLCKKIEGCKIKKERNKSYYELKSDYIGQNEFDRIHNLVIEDCQHEFDTDRETLIYEILDSTHSYVKASKMVNEQKTIKGEFIR